MSQKLFRKIAALFVVIFLVVPPVHGLEMNAIPNISNVYTTPNYGMYFDPYKGLLPIFYTLSNSDATVIVEVFDGAISPGEQFLYQYSATKPKGSHQVNWDGKYSNNNPVAEKDYTIRVSAYTPYGTDVEYANITVKYEKTDSCFTLNTVPTVNNITASPNPFNPYNQGTELSYYLVNAPAKMTIQIWDVYNNIPNKNDMVIETLLNYSCQTPGKRAVTWDGRDGFGNPFPVGQYKYYITADYKYNNVYDSYTTTGTVNITHSNNPSPAAPQISGISASTNYGSYFDPHKGSSTIQYTLSGSDAEVTVEVFDGTISAGEQPIYKYWATKGMGTHQVSWYGKYSNNVVVPQKDYTYRVSAYNNYGSDEKSDIITVKYESNYPDPASAPNIAGNDYASPNPFNPDQEQTSIYFTTDKTADVRLEILDNGTPVYTSPMSYGLQSGNHILKWDGWYTNHTGKASGKNYVYRITATNQYGSDIELGTVGVVYGIDPYGTKPYITNDYASPSIFNPDNDNSRIYFTLDKSAKVTVEIFRDGMINDAYRVATLASNQTETSGTHYYTWYGNNMGNIQDGTYTYRILATNIAGTDEETGTVKVQRDGNSFDDLIINVNVPDKLINPGKNEMGSVNFDVLQNDTDITVEIVKMPSICYTTGQVSSYCVNNSTTIRTLVAKKYFAGDDYTVSWNGRDAAYGGAIVNDGLYSFKVKAQKAYFTQTEYRYIEVDTDSIDNGSIGDLISNIEVPNFIFNPSDSEKSTVYFDVNQDGVKITVEVLDGSKQIRLLKDGLYYNKGTNYSVIWNGYDKYGDWENGMYKFKITAYKNGKTEIAYHSVEIDTSNNTDDTIAKCGFKDAGGKYCEIFLLLKEKGAFQGYSDGTVRPYQILNRGEGAKLATHVNSIALLADDGTDLGFWDVIKGAWYMKYFRTGMYHNYFHGNPDGSARPEKNLNKVEFLKLFYEANGMNLNSCTPPAKDTMQTWYTKYACHAINHGYMDLDSSGNFNPGSSISRGEAAEFLYRFYQSQN